MGATHILECCKLKRFVYLLSLLLYLEYCVSDDDDDSDEDSDDDSDWDEDEDDDESETGGYDLDICPPGCDQVYLIYLILHSLN